MSGESWAEYVRRITAHLTQSKAAELAGVNPAAIGRWIRGDTDAPRAESVVAFARALGLPPVEALVAAGYINAGETNHAIEVRTPISDYSDIELLDELKRRATGAAKG